MPKVLGKGNRSVSLDDKNYNYPLSMPLQPGTDLHDSLRDKILERAQSSINDLSVKFQGWREIDNTMTAYIDLSEDERDIKQDDNRKPVSIVIPISYASMQVNLTYMMSALLVDPIFKLEGFGGKDMAKAIILESLLSYQARKMKMMLELHTAWQDAYKYGFGYVFLDWYVQELLMPTEGIRDRFERRNNVMFEGNRLIAGNPYNFIFDTSLPVYKVRDMEYIGTIDRMNYSALLREELINPELLFNVRYMEDIDGVSSLTDTLYRSGDENNLNTGFDKGSSLYTKPIDVITLLVDLIPSDWELGGSDRPEKWIFKLAGDQVIISARPLNAMHDMFPAVVFAPDFDGHSIVSSSRMQINDGLQNAINHLWNAHITNNRKMVNNIMAFDPGILNYNDAVNMKEGAFIRARKSQWGLGRIRDGIFQVPIQDVTARNLIDISMLKDISEMVTGSRTSISGGIHQKGERVSAAEARQASMAALSRMEKDARIIYSQGMQDLTTMMVLNILQYMENTEFVRLTRDVSEDLMQEMGADNGVVPVDISDLSDVQFDVMSHDGTIPGAASDANATVQFFQTLTSPEVSQAFDIPRLAARIGRQLGIKDIELYKRGVNVKVLPDETISNRVQKGDIIPS